ncbi:MAG TPA: DUF4367 domain-containing protein [Syntrophomonadaceae bacterium]|nr:DUF4367 domain-containing protein [Syntrophomonadaceae bacterium]
MSDPCLDKLIKEAVTEQIKSFPVPDMDEEWELLQKRIYTEKKREAWIKRAAIAAAVFLGLTGILAGVYPVQAGNLKNAVIRLIDKRILGPMHNLVINTGASDRGDVPPDTVNIPKPLRTSSLEKAVEFAGRPFWIPAETPEGLELDEIEVTKEEGGVLSVRLLYRHNEKYYSIMETLIEKRGSKGILYDTDDSEVSKIKIGQSDAVLIINNKHGTYNLDWYLGDWSFSAFSNLGEKEIITISSSLIPTNAVGK